MIAREIMTKNLLTVDKDRNIEDAIRIMEKHHVSRLLTTEKGRIIGILAESDITERLASGKERKLKVGHIHISSGMKKYLRVVYPEEDVKEVARQMIEYGISSLAVEEKEEIIGIITKTDLVRVLVTSDKKVGEFYTKNPAICNMGDRLVHARKMMVENKVHRLIVTDKGMIVGMLTDRDIARGLKTYRQALDKFHHPQLEMLTVEQVMSRNPTVVKPETKIGEAVRLMLDKNISGLPVSGPDYGILTKTDLVRGIAVGKLP
jgi:CBS domain-containing protein